MVMPVPPLRIAVCRLQRDLPCHVARERGLNKNQRGKALDGKFITSKMANSIPTATLPACTAAGTAGAQPWA